MTIADIQQEAYDLVDATSTSYTATTLLRRLNIAYEETIGDILGMDGMWDFDDTRYTTFPIGTTTMVASQSDYTFDITHLEIQQVEIKDNNGLWHVLDPMDRSELAEQGIAIEEFQKVAGIPIEYDKQGSSILLYPSPATGSVTLANGLRVFFKRTASVFTSAELTTGTAIPGFASPFHVILSYKAALPYATAFKKDRVSFILGEIKRVHAAMESFYGRREQDVRKLLRPAQINPR